MVMMRSVDFGRKVKAGQPPALALRTSSSFKKRDLENESDVDEKSDHDNVLQLVGESTMSSTMSFKKKKPGELKLQMARLCGTLINTDCDQLVNYKEEAHNSITYSSPDQAALFLSSKPATQLHAAATKLQKFYKSYRTRRNLADCAVVVEELWRKALEFAALKRSSVSFFNSNKSETAVSRWARARTRAAKVGKGLSKDVKGQQLALRHWLEAIDPRHRYGHNLHLYYNVWFESGSFQPFFYWLDVGDGKDVNLDKCPRTNLQRQCIKYLGPKEREAYEVIVERGKLIYKESKVAVHTGEGSKWIFVLSTSKILYVGQKEKCLFHHSSFLAGGATIASGRLVVSHGTLNAVWAYSGHYRPTEENFMELCSFLEEHHVDLTDVKKYPIDDDVIPSKVKPSSESAKETADHHQNTCSSNNNNNHDSEPIDHANNINVKDERRRLLVDKAAAAAAKAGVKYTWSTGVGPRIGCVRDYPPQLQFKALEQLHLSPRLKPYSSLLTTATTAAPIPSPRPTPSLHLSPRLASLGLLSPRVRVSATNYRPS